MPLKVHFVDFWPGFVPDQSYFFHLLGGNEKLELSDDPELIFFSNFGVEHKKYDCFKVFFSSENERPNMFKCDIALTSDYSSNKRHFRLPLFVLYLHHYQIDANQLNRGITREEIKEWKKTIRIMLEQDGYFDEDGFRYINGRQTELHLVGK